MSDHLVKRAREALDGVTGGPWDAVKERAGDTTWVWIAPASWVTRVARIVLYSGEEVEQEANARFILASRDLVPAMANRIETLTAERDAAQARADALAEKLEDAAQIISQCTWSTMYVRGQYVDRKEVVQSYRAARAQIGDKTDG